MERSPNRVAFLDEIRGIAIIAVFLFHSLWATCGINELPWGNWFRDFKVSHSFLYLLPLSFGWSGVAIFFVVSGFCIHLSFARKTDWRDFCIRRFFRIYPPYFFAVILFALLIPWTRIGCNLYGAAQLGSHLLLVHTFDARAFFGINPVFWSIAVEVQLYVLYPVLLALVAHLGWRRSLAYICALEVGLRIIESIVSVDTGEGPPLWLVGFPFVYWFSWSIGAAVADAHVSGRPVPFSNHSLFAWSVAAVGSVFFKPCASFSFLFFALLTATAIAKLLNREYNPAAFRLFSAPLRTVGLWSFSIYLLHQPFLVLAPLMAAKLSSTGRTYPLVVFILCLCLWFPIIAISALWYRLIEVPSIEIGRNIAKRKPKK